MLVIKQCSNQWKVKQKRLEALHSIVLGLISRLKNISFEHVSRKDNEIADTLGRSWFAIFIIISHTFNILFSSSLYLNVVAVKPLKNCLQFSVGGIDVFGTFDNKNKDGVFIFIDSVFLYSLPQGKDLLKSSSSSVYYNCKDNVNVHMFVLGEISSISGNFWSFHPFYF